MRICITCDGISATDVEKCAHCGTPLLSTSEVHFPLRRGEADAGHPLLGQLIGGKYRLQGVLGKGGMGTVFRAVHEVSLVPVALKLLHRRFAARPEYREWFLAEARKAGRVTHEHSARVQDVGETEDGTVFLAMELATGLPLSAWLARGATLPANVVLEIMSQIARALAAAHEVGVVHRDLSPRNISVSVRDHAPFVKILDFGIAKGVVEAGPLHGDSDAMTAPTGYANPVYAAPEHLRGEEADERADLYSLGVIAYQALNGKLPVRGSTGPELASATISGDIEPMRARAAVPTRLVRLVNHLLELDPVDRPANAVSVAAELQRIRHSGPQRWVRATAAAVAMVAMVLSIAAFSAAPSPYLLARAGSKLPVTARAAAVRVTTQLRSVDLARIDLEFQGFDPRRLELQLTRGANELETLPLDPEVRGAQLRLSASRPLWQQAIQRIAVHSRDGDVDLAFRAPGGKPLAFSRVRLDDEAPVVTLECDDPLLNGATRLTVRAEDGTAVDRLELVLEHDGVEHRITPAGESVSVTAAWGEAFPGVGDFGAVRIRAEASDRSGNQASSPDLSWDHFDLRAPRILSTSTQITFDRRGASVRLRLSDPEPDLEVSVRGPGGEPMALTKRVLDDRIDITLDVPEGGGFVDGTYSVSIEDRLRNRSDFLEEWRFFARDPQVRIVTASGRVVNWSEGGFVSDGSAILFDLSCGTLYRPRAVALRDPEGRTVGAEVSEGSGSTWRVAVPPLPDGDYTLEIDLVSSSEDIEASATAPFRLMVRSRPPTLRLPALDSVRFLRDLVDTRSVLRLDPEGLLREASEWNWSDTDRRMLRGWVWTGDDVQLTPRAIQPSVGASDPVLTSVSVRSGTNVVGLELVDVLGRPLEVWIGDSPAPICEPEPGRRVAKVVTFYHRDQPCRSLEPVVRVEYGQAVRFTVRCELPLQGLEGVALQLGRVSVAPRSWRVGDRNDEAWFDFVASFEALASAAGLTTASAAEFLELGEFDVDARMRTPAGEDRLPLRFAPTRSSLIPVQLAQIGGGLPLALRGIELVPSLGPRGAFADPVPNDLAARASYRALPEREVRALGDVYLQRAELTRVQYEAIRREGLERVSSVAGLDWKAFVHRADPAGASRLEGDALVPVAFRDDDRWTAALDAAPDRAVQGIDFFQAYTISRLAGLLVAGDPALMRLPMGTELEYAALGARRERALRLNGSPAVSGTYFRGVDVQNLLRWPPTAEENIEHGDGVVTDLGFQLVGLDFGVREWVGDLPYSRGLTDDALLREWLSDHLRHSQRVELFATRVDSDLPEELRGFFGRIGVIRGLASGEARNLIDGANGRPVYGETIGSRVPGVVRCRNLRRDGREPASDALQAVVWYTGMRLAGGASFVARVRNR